MTHGLLLHLGIRTEYTDKNEYVYTSTRLVVRWDLMGVLDNNLDTSKID